MMRLDKYLAERTGMTRSESRKAITKGRVMVAGKICRKADTQLDETAAQIALDGAPLAGEYKKYVYIMLNKPEGVVSASRDKRDTTVVDLVAADYPRRELFPAGRLDKTSTGFVLLTDDGALAHDILAPAHHVDKQYLVTLDTPLTEEMRKVLRHEFRHHVEGRAGVRDLEVWDEEQIAAYRAQSREEDEKGQGA